MKITIIYLSLGDAGHLHQKCIQMTPPYLNDTVDEGLMIFLFTKLQIIQRQLSLKPFIILENFINICMIEDWKIYNFHLYFFHIAM